MSYTYKLVRRLALLRGFAVAAAIGALACTEVPTSGPDAAAVPGAPRPMLDLASGVIEVGARVQTTGTANIRSGPAGSSSLLGVQPAGALGTVVGGPVVDSSGDGLLRWNVNFDAGVDGWAAEPYAGLTLVASAPPSTGGTVASVTVTPGSASLAVGGTAQLAAVASDAGGTPVSATITWSSLNPQIAGVSSSGLVTGVAAGGTFLVATAGGKADTAAVTVTAAAAPSGLVVGARVKTTGTANVKSSASTGSTHVGSQPAGATGTIVGGPVVDPQYSGLTWWNVNFDSGPDGWVAQSYAGLTPLSPAPAPTVSVVDVTPATAAVTVGQTVQLAAVAKDGSGTVLSGATMAWTSRDTLKAKVTAAGLVTGIAAGTVYVVVTSGGKSDSSQVTVTAPSTPAVATVTVSPSTASLLVAATQQFTATAKDASGNPISGAVVTWSVSNALLATVSGSGLVTALSLGSVTVTATSGGKTGSATITIAAPSSTTHKGWYASPTGSSSGAGTTSSPWSLTTALAGGNGKVQPGDTVWLRGGTYRGAYTSTVAGTASAPVVIAQYPGERATLDGAGLTGDQLIVKGQWTVFMDFEVMNSSPSRSTSTTSNNWRPNNVVNNASNTKYINLIIHDGGVAFFNYTTQRNVEVYGCILYNNGWQAPDRGHGHGLYVKSDVGPVVLRDNILFGQFGYGIHIYSNSGSGFLNNITLDGNVAFNNGTTSNNSTSPNILYGGSATATGATVVNNLTYYSPGAGGANVRIGHGSTKNGSASVQGNYAVGGSPVLDLGYWSSATVSSNTLVGSSTVVALNDATTSGKQFSANTHRRDPSTSSWKYKGTSYNWTSWKSATALASSDQAMTGVPTATHVVTRVNPHVKGRGYVAVYNWARQGSVSVSLSGILSVGDQYVVRNAQNPFGAPVASGTFGGGSVTLPLSGITPPAPIGWTRSAPKTGPDFDVFVVQKI